MTGLDALRSAARGRWLSILPQLVPALAEAARRPGRPRPCPNPAHAPSKDGFRFYADSDQNGSAVCNTCGTFRSGFDVIVWLTGVSLAEATARVASALNGNGAGAPAPHRT